MSVRLRLTNVDFARQPRSAFNNFDGFFATRKQEADDFYATIVPHDLSPDAKNVMRQGFAGLLWSKQFYHYVVNQWLQGDPGHPPPPPERTRGRNHDWPHLYNADVISMPDKWEYPWYAAWDLAFHCVSLALVDPDFAKEQLVLLLREWYMHPNGQFPAYEWALGDVNPPVHAWAAWRVYKIDKKRNGRGDRAFLVRVFHKLLLNFTWWVNRKDAEGMNIFQGGFLGLDNIGVFNRSDPLPTGGHIEQSDGTSWMAMYTLNLLAIAMELATQDPAYEDVASKFWEHFIYIAYAMNHLGHDGMGLWNGEDGFFYDVIKFPDGTSFPVKIRSMVGLIPLFAVETLEPGLLDRLPGFKRRMEWFIDNRPDLTANVASMRTCGMGERRLLSIVDAGQLQRMLQIMLDEQEFLSPHGIRALSLHHRDHPFVISFDGKEHRVDYEPGESSTGLFGGNSNWRGPVWFPVNYLLIESLQKVPSLFRRRPQSGISFAFRQNAHAFRSRRANLAPLDRNLSARRTREPPRQRRRAKISHRSELERSDSLLRILSRRHGSGPGCEPSDGLDCVGGQVASAEWPVSQACGDIREQPPAQVADLFAAAVTRRCRSGAFMRRQDSAKAGCGPRQRSSSIVSKTGASTRKVASLRNSTASSHALNNDSDNARALRIDGFHSRQSFGILSRCA